MRDTTRITIEVPPEVKERIKEASRKALTPFSIWCRVAILMALEEAEENNNG